MYISRRRFLSVSASGALALQAAASAQEPSAVVRLVVPFPAGGPSDDIARILADSINTASGMRMIVDNRPGASGALAVGQAAKGQGDGSVLLFASLGALAIAPHMRKVGYEPLKDFAPVALIASLSPVYAIHPQVPAKNVQELVALARAAPGKISLGTSGNGSTVHVSIELLRAAAKVDITHVPYKGIAPALNDALGGQITGVVADVPGVISHIRAGKLRAIGVAAPQRSTLLPDTPTLREQGFDDVDAPNWVGVLLPAGTPKPLQAKFGAVVAAAMANPVTRERLLKIGTTPGTLTGPKAFGDYLASEYQRWGERVARFDIKGE